MIGKHCTLVVLAFMSAAILLPHEVASFVYQNKQSIELSTPDIYGASATLGNTVADTITNTLSNGVGGIGSISEQEADAILGPLKKATPGGGRGPGNGVGGIGSVSEQEAAAIFNPVTNRPEKGTRSILTATQPTRSARGMPATGAGGQAAVSPGLILSIVAALIALLAGGLLRRRATH